MSITEATVVKMPESPEPPTTASAPSGLPGSLELGAFSVSLSVADLAVSLAFYEKLGFEVTGGGTEHSYLILKNGETTLGLFHGMFQGNILTFNPGLTNRMERLDSYPTSARSRPRSTPPTCRSARAPRTARGQPR